MPRKTTAKAAAMRGRARRPAKPPASTDLTAALLADFAKHGSEAIAQARDGNPIQYLRLVAPLLENEKGNPLAEVTDAELAEMIAMLRDAITAAKAKRGGR
jgi:hypothetical protein